MRIMFSPPVLYSQIRRRREINIDRSTPMLGISLDLFLF